MGVRVKLALGLVVFGFLILTIAYPITNAISSAYQGTELQGLSILFIFGVVTPIIVVGAFAFSYLFGRWTIDPALKISKASKKLANGDFDVELDLKPSDDEIGDMIKAYQEFVANTVKPIRQLNTAAKAYAGGDFSSNIDIRAKGEINELVDSVRRMVNNVIRPIRELKVVSKLVAEGNLDKDIDIEAKGEMKELIDSYTQMLGNLRTLVKNAWETGNIVATSTQELASSSEQMNATAQQVSSSTQQISKGSSTQAERVEETAKVISTMTKAVDGVARDSRTAKDISSKSNEIAGIGRESVNESVRKMEQIYQSVNASAEVISALGERSKEITQILDVITNITDQTNLLALNAAIEAARAGEHGRGFAVVAEEVKNLAEDSKEAADKIALIIREIQANTGKAVDSMNQGTKEVSEGMEIVNRAGKALGEVAEMSKRTAELVEGISNATEQQKAGTEVVAAAIDEIATIAEESASASQESASGVEELTASMEEMTARTQELSEMAVSLQKSIGTFKLSDWKAPSPRTPRRATIIKRTQQNGQPKLPEKVAASLKKRGIETDEREA